MAHRVIPKSQQTSSPQKHWTVVEFGQRSSQSRTPSSSASAEGSLSQSSGMVSLSQSGSQASGIPLVLQSSKASQSSGTPVLSQSMSHSSGIPFALQSSNVWQSSGVPSPSQSVSHSSGDWFLLQSGAPSRISWASSMPLLLQSNRVTSGATVVADMDAGEPGLNRVMVAVSVVSGGAFVSKRKL